jgi:hypothetical protein
MDEEALAKLVRERAGDCCEYCRLPQIFSSTRFQIDHVIAEQHGGKTVFSNLALACLADNTSAVILSMLRKLFVPTRSLSGN